ncbi:uncharacterized protein [Eucyclogobius newberryi]|uniref:uncharacterized protein n=1 Tax=Eucyclogobius newberryi TaxID=166745 RepID=UPI003B5CD27F
MTRVALTKLGVLVILTFIMCLPEFFIMNRELRASLLCVRPPLCDEESGGPHGDSSSSSSSSSSTCGEHWEQMRAAADQRNMTQADGSCFVCRAEVNAAGLDHNSSSPAETVSMEVLATLWQSNNASADITLLGRYNRSSRYLRFPDVEGGGGGEPGDSFLYCPPPVEAANHSCCLLRLSARTFARGGLPWKRSAEDEWRCVLWVVWLFLLGVLLLLIIITLTSIAEGRGRCSGKTILLLHLEKNCTSSNVDKESPYSWSALSSIEEEDSSDDVFCND